MVQLKLKKRVLLLFNANRWSQTLSAIFVTRTSLYILCLKWEANEMLGFWIDKLSWLVMTILLNTINQVVSTNNHQTHHHSGQLTIWLRIIVNGIHNSTKYRLYFPVPAVLLYTNIACYLCYSLWDKIVFQQLHLYLIQPA